MKNPEEYTIDEATSILHQRYGWVREEILLRLEYRYKIINLALVLFPAALGFIWAYQAYPISFIICILGLILELLFYAENKAIVDLASYLLEIENILDTRHKNNIVGWERYSRESEFFKKKATKHLVFAFNLFFITFYTIFNAIGSIYWIQDHNALWFSALTLPLLIFSIWAYKLLKDYKDQESLRLINEMKRNA